MRKYLPFHMRGSFVVLFSLLFSFFGYSQTYFQQEVSYNIVAELNDENHELSGNSTLIYTNNSSDILNEIYIHLWPNAFKNKRSFFTKDQLRFGKRAFYFAKDNQLGGYEEINFIVNGSAPVVEYVDGYEDVAKIVLNKPLKPSETVEIIADFKLKVPHFFSRLGRTRNTYHFMHWYPRVAVYDKEGWHPYHYGMIGEFYGEFGNYNVVLTVPSYLRIGFTGKGIAALPSTNEDKTMTWTITADRVHDFAWVAGKNYITDFDKVKSIDGREISLTILRREGERPNWKKAMDYLKESFAFYEENVGPYAYDEVVVVQGTRKGHGNMEYPGLILVTDRGTDKSLDYYINHELGHQWFYGAIGFNERDEPWLDEGLTTFYEHRYTMGKYGKQHYTDQLDGILKNPADQNINHAVVQQQINTGFSQRADTPLNEMSAINYGIRAYEQAAASYLYLEEYLGKTELDKIMHSFYSEWKFKHPGTKELQTHFENASGETLDWFFEELLIGNKPIDYKLGNVTDKGDTYLVNIENKGAVNLPIPIDGYRDGKRVFTKFVELNGTDSSVEIEAKDLDRISIDGENLLFDVNRENNHSTGFFKNVKFSLLNRLNSSSERNIFVLPVLGINSADGFYAGLGLTNSTMPSKRFQIRGLFAYAFDSKSIVGGGDINYSFYPKDSRFRKIKVGVSQKSFHYRVLDNQMDMDNLFARYVKYQPYAKFHFKSSDKKEKYITARTVFINQEKFEFNPVGESSDFYLTHLVSYNAKNYRALYPSDLEIGLEFSAYENLLQENHNYLKMSLTYNQGFYFAKNKSVDFRFFGGGFLFNSQKESSSFYNGINRGSLSLFNEGYNDLLFDHPFQNRVGQRANLFVLNQVRIREGGFKNALGSQTSIGQSNQYLVSVNLQSDLPISLPWFLPIKVFGDAGVFSTKSVESQPLERELLYSAGIMLDFKAFQVHLPLFYSEQIKLAYGSERERFYQRITFAIKLNEFLIWDTIDNRRF